jgi:hypothetical protein
LIKSGSLKGSRKLMWMAPFFCAAISAVAGLRTRSTASAAARVPDRSDVIEAPASV